VDYIFYVDLMVTWCVFVCVLVCVCHAESINIGSIMVLVLSYVL
jgi:hypothetical protein